MACEFCGGTCGEHLTSCPNYSAPPSKYHCEICENGIYDGEEYIEDDGRFAHWDCINSKWELAEFLGCERKEMEDDEY